MAVLHRTHTQLLARKADALCNGGPGFPFSHAGLSAGPFCCACSDNAHIVSRSPAFFEDPTDQAGETPVAWVKHFVPHSCNPASAQPMVLQAGK